jgi:hypothetical protein
MNHYKYIVLSIQDMSSGDNVGSVHDYQLLGDYCKVSKPMEYCVPSDNMEALLNAKEVLEQAMNSIYMCKHSTNGTVFVETPGYITGIDIYNINKSREESTGSINPTKAFRKLPRGRFQITQIFSSKGRQPISVLGDLREENDYY